MKCKRKIMVGIAFVAVVLCILFQSNTFGRKKSELIIEEVDLKNNCIYAVSYTHLIRHFYWFVVHYTQSM